MPKTYTQYVCTNCGRISARQMGRCHQCGSWNSLVEKVIAPPPKLKRKSPKGVSLQSEPRRLKDVDDSARDRIPIGISEISRVLGGGVVPGSVVLIGGDPGIGKSTLLLQAALDMAGEGVVLYVSGEESERQIKMRAQRLLNANTAGEREIPDKLYLVTETNYDQIMLHVNDLKPVLLIVDSIQTTYLPQLESSAGSVSQVRECASSLREAAKTTGITVFIIGHVTKEGAIAGPRILEHIVDTVLYLEGDRFQSFRLLRSVKNRYGPTSEVGVFEMRERGMVEVKNPSEAFLAERAINSPGSAIAVTMEGTRPILVEIQGLTSPTSFGNPRRTPNGIDFNRLLLTIAVLSRRVGMNLADKDVFINVVSGLKVSEPAADLAVAAVIASSNRDQPIPVDTVLIGEVGLSGELRMVSHIQARLKEAQKLGFKKAIIPKRIRGKQSWPPEIDVKEVRSLRAALKLLFNNKQD